MNLKDAEKEFRLREYVWAKSEWEREINESFPHMRMFKTGHAWDIYQFMQKLNKEEQLALAMGRLKQQSPELTSKWGDNLSEEEKSLCKKFHAFWSIRGQFYEFKQLWNKEKNPDVKFLFDGLCEGAAKIFFDRDSDNSEFLVAELEKFLSPLSWGEQVKARKLAGEKIKFISKKKLQKIVTQKGKDFFGNQCEECRVNEGYAGHWTSFDVKCGGWMITTQFNFGRKPGYQQSVLGHWHNICSQKKTLRPAIPEYGIPEFMDTIAYLCRWVHWPCAWEWEFLTEDDVELACEETFKYCRRFFEAAPKLLKGLDVEGISEN
ncbi:MAG TPA: hypothetical protein VHG71_09620 [Verrucomicrobiae bacterium]|nr:hypothetical protein [Verrucomicrobiae bacterium]